MDGVILTPLKKIYHPKGDIFHAMKASDKSFFGFGEAYLTTIKKNEIKGWKKHLSMTLNLVVLSGEVKFVIFNMSKKTFFSVNLSLSNYQRLTVRPGYWVAFKGMGEGSMMLNLANIEHDPKESENLNLNAVDYDW
jgi:dTDP-4-dehydrorhamnose 3,5-epimerase